MKPSLNHNKGFSLIEVSLALGVAAFCLIAILGLLPTGVNSDQLSLEQTAAAGVANAVVADLQATPQASATAGSFSVSPHFNLTVPSKSYVVTNSSVTTPLTKVIFLDANGETTGNEGVNAVPTSRYRVTIYYSLPKFSATALTMPSPTNFVPVVARVLVTWPALADQNASTATPANFAGSFEVVTTLDRN